MSVVRRAPLMVTLACAGACHDVVIGTFVAGEETASSGRVDDSTGPVAGSSGDTGGWPGGCIELDFASAQLDEHAWITWADADATLAVADGAFMMTPPHAAELGCGLVLNNQLALPFDGARAQVELVVPPDPLSDSEFFLQVTQHVPLTEAAISIGLLHGQVRVLTVPDEGGPVVPELVADATPRWLGLRTAAGVVHFEISDDGVTWTEVASAPQPSTFTGATPLVMVWNNPGAGVATPQAVVVDHVSVCDG